MSGSRGKNRHEEEHEEHVNHEAWVIPYADVLTLLMALFLVLWALGDPNAEKIEVAADSFRRELGGAGTSPFDIGVGSGGSGTFTEGGTSVFQGAGPAPIAGSDQTPEPASESSETEIVPAHFDIIPSLDPAVMIMPSAAVVGGEGAIEDEADGDGTAGGGVDAPIGDPLDYVESVVREHAEGTGLTTKIGFRREARGLVVSIVADQVLFNTARARVEPAGVAILDVVADALAELENGVVIEGHTDSRPISTARYPSNWELSTARATSVLRYLVETRGLDPDRISAAGYADTRPISEGTDSESMAQNRRVEIVVLGAT